MQTTIIDNGSSYIDSLRALLSDFEPTVVGYRHIDISKIEQDELVVLSGGHHYPVKWHDKEYQREIQLINEHPGPVIGVCLGFQLIAHVFGCRLQLLDNRRKGVVCLRPVEGSEIIPDATEVLVYESHNWVVPEARLPLQAIAISDDGVEVLRHQSKSIYGMQFHPEKTEGNRGNIIFKNILQEITTKK